MVLALVVTILLSAIASSSVTLMSPEPALIAAESTAVIKVAPVDEVTVKSAPETFAVVVTELSDVLMLTSPVLVNAASIVTAPVVVLMLVSLPAVMV